MSRPATEDQIEAPPRVSIGLPVYNGERYLAEALDSLLGQTFEDIELIICDNASTDATEKICRDYASRDPRIRYSRNDTNIGGARNENLTFSLARGEFYRLSAHDDVCEPTLIERCVEVLDQHPEVVLSFPAIMSIDGDGQRLGVRYGSEGAQARPSERFRQLTRRTYPCDAVYGVVRSAVRREVGTAQNYTGSDRVLLAGFALRGPFRRVDEALFNKRFHEGNRYNEWRLRMAWFSPELASEGRPTFPNWLRLFDYLRTIRCAPLNWAERQRCRVWTGRWVLAHAKGLGYDLFQAARMMLHSRSWRAEQYANEGLWR